MAWGELYSNVIVAHKLWGPLWDDNNVKIQCDNQAVVEVVNIGRARDQILGTCARNVWLFTAFSGSLC